jgi:hypothetical protein
MYPSVMVWIGRWISQILPCRSRRAAAVRAGMGIHGLSASRGIFT